jgi:hypothetical protein
MTIWRAMTKRATKAATMRRALSDKNLLGGVLEGDSWLAWRVLLIASKGEELTDEERAIFQRLTGRAREPLEPVEEFEAVAGRRAGKSRAASVMSIYEAAFVDHSRVVVEGERPVVLCLSPTTKQAGVVFGYVAGIMDATPLLAGLIASRTQDTLTLSNGIDITVRPASFRGVRGTTSVAVIADEAAFWHSDEDAANPDTAILDAVRPSLATTGGPMIIISTPYARRGVVFETWAKHFGAKGDPKILVAQGASRDFNPSLPQSVVDRALERDPIAASAEWLGQFRSDLERFVSGEAVEACVSLDVRERAPLSGNRYSAFVDPSGGSADSMALAVGHKEGNGVILDAIRERRPPFSPEDVVSEFADLLKSYRIDRVQGDRYAGEWPRERFREKGIKYEPAAKPKSDLYRDLLPALNSRRIDLLDNSRLIAQIVGLERRTSRGGRDSIDHPPGAHDDVANCVAGVAAALAVGGGYRADLSWVIGPDDEEAKAKMNYLYALTGQGSRRWYE